MSENEDEADPTPKFTFKPSFVIVAIDVHPSMFETRENDETVTHPFKDALTACYEVVDSLVLASNSRNWNSYNPFGVVIAREDAAAASLVEVQNNVLDSVKFLKKECTLDNEELRRRYERLTDPDLAAFFLLCKKKFRDIKAAFYKRTIVFITNNDNPAGGDAQRRFAALNEAKTFGAAEITFELVTMRHDFDYTVFYNELFTVYSDAAPVEQVCEDKDGLVDKLLSSIVFRHARQRYNFFPFKDDRERYLRVVKVNFFKKAKLFNSDKVSRGGKLLKRVHEKSGVEASAHHQFTLRMGTGSEPLKLDLKDKYDIYGNDLPLGFHLCYVSPRQTEFGVCGKPTSMLMVDPCEDLPFFDQFWQYCVDNDRVLVCIKKTKHPEKVRYVELIPKFANDAKMFLVKHIPFCNELRWPNKRLEMAEQSDFDSTTEQRKCVEDMVERLTFEYHPKMLSNPSYANKKAYVKAKLLDEPKQEVIDVTLNVEEMDNQIRDVVEEMKVLFHLQELVGKGKKRKAAGSSRGGRGKKFAK